MDIDEDDDFYAPDEQDTQTSAPQHVSVPDASQLQGKAIRADELEEGEEEDEGTAMEEDNSDIDIITERKDGSVPANTSSRYGEIRNIPQRSATLDSTLKQAQAKRDRAPAYTAAPSACYNIRGNALSIDPNYTIDIDANPVLPEVGKPITQVDIDEDLPEHEQPWRKPGTDISDYFNYGFDEFTWAMYAAKQNSIRSEFNSESVAAKNKKMMEDFNNLMMMGGMGIPGAPHGQGGASGQTAVMGAGSGMETMPPEMQQMMQQMMAAGMDPSQMDPSAMSAMFAGMQNPGAAGGAQGGPGQNYGQGFVNQGQAYGFDQNMAGSSNTGGFGGRGHGARRW